MHDMVVCMMWDVSRASLHFGQELFISPLKIDPEPTAKSVEMQLIWREKYSRIYVITCSRVGRVVAAIVNLTGNSFMTEYERIRLKESSVRHNLRSRALE